MNSSHNKLKENTIRATKIYKKRTTETVKMDKMHTTETVKMHKKNSRNERLHKEIVLK